MHPAQLHGIEAQTLAALFELFEERQESEEGEPDVALSSVRLLAGIPYRLDDSFPMDVIELRAGEETLFRLETLAIPAAFAA